MSIVSHDQVRAAVARALLLGQDGDMEIAIASAASALCIAVEAVRNVVQAGCVEARQMSEAA